MSRPPGEESATETAATSSRTGSEKRFGNLRRYELGEQIGSGAAASVYRCFPVEERDSGNNTERITYAVKIIDLRALRLRPDHERERQKLRREVSILRQMHHTSIVNLEEVIETTDRLYLVMELVSHGELFFHIVEKKHLSEAAARYIFRQVLTAVQYMHSKGVIHRDLKPENILIADEYEHGFCRVKVADFGLAKLVDSNHSRARTFVGTPQYWAPEVIDASRTGGTYGPEADIWSLGVLLYVMIGGTYPFDTRRGAVEDQIRAGDFHFRYAAFTTVTPAALHLIRRLMTVPVKDRITIPEIERHEWLEQAKQDNAPPLPPVFSRSLSSHRQANSERDPTGLSEEVVRREGASIRPQIVSFSSEAAQPRSQISSLHSRDSVEPAPGGGERARGVDTDPGGPLQACHVERSERGERDVRTAVPRTSDSARENCINGESAANAVFSFRELASLQLSIASRFEMAWLAFRDDPSMARRIRKGAVECRDRHLRSTRVIRSFAGTCESVLELLPDLAAAVQENEPALGTELMRLVRQWVQQMRAEAAQIQHEYTGMIRDINTLIECARARKHNADQSNDRMDASVIREGADAASRVRPASQASNGDVAGVSSHQHRQETSSPVSGTSSPRLPSSAQTINAGERGLEALLPERTTDSIREQLLKDLSSSIDGDACRGQSTSKSEDNSPGFAAHISLDATDQPRNNPVARTHAPMAVPMPSRDAVTLELMELLFLTPGVLHLPLTAQPEPKMLTETWENPAAHPVRALERCMPAAEGQSSSHGSDQAHDRGVQVRQEASGWSSDGGIPPAGAGDAAMGNTSSVGSPSPPRFAFDPEKTAHEQSPCTSLNLYAAPHVGGQVLGGIANPSRKEVLLKALNELRKVDRILSRCVNFWTGIDCTVERLSQMKDKTEKLIAYAHHSRFRERFNQRMRDYEKFWSELRRLCREYVRDASEQADRVYDFLSDITQTADVMDALHHDKQLSGLDNCVLEESAREHEIIHRSVATSSPLAEGRRFDGARPPQMR